MVHYDTTVFYKNSLGRATFCRLTELQPVQKCKLYKIADLDKIVAPQPSPHGTVEPSLVSNPSDLLTPIYRFGFIIFQILSHEEACYYIRENRVIFYNSRLMLVLISWVLNQILGCNEEAGTTWMDLRQHIKEGNVWCYDLVINWHVPGVDCCSECLSMYEIFCDCWVGDIWCSGDQVWPY